MYGAEQVRLLGAIGDQYNAAFVGWGVIVALVAGGWSAFKAGWLGTKDDVSPVLYVMFGLAFVVFLRRVHVGAYLLAFIMGFFRKPTCKLRSAADISKAFGLNEG